MKFIAALSFLIIGGCCHEPLPATDSGPEEEMELVCIMDGAEVPCDWTDTRCSLWECDGVQVCCPRPTSYGCGPFICSDVPCEDICIGSEI